MDYRYRHEVRIHIENLFLEGELIIPERAAAIILFSHGSGSSHRSPRNQKVAEVLQNAGFGTLLFDLLTPVEDEVYANRFAIPLLAGRLAAVTQWLEERSEAQNCRMGYFGASTGAAAALIAASRLPQIAAVVSRGGRVDLAGDAIGKVQAPTLLIVGGFDAQVLGLNQKVYDILQCAKKLEIVKGATHLFEEHGAMDRVCALARNWFTHYLPTATMA